MSHRKPRRIAAALLLLAGALAAQQIVEEIVAIVNDEIITLSDFKREYDQQLAVARAQLQGEELDKAEEQMKANLLDAMITNRLILQLAKQRNFNVSDQLKMAVDGIKKDNNIESDEELKRALRSQGIDYDVWVKQIEEKILRDGVIYTEVNKLLALDESQIVEYYKAHKDEFTQPAEIKARAVYLGLGDRTDQELAARKAEISGKIKDGLDFAEAAAAYSDAPLKETKGELGTLVMGQTDKALEAVLLPLPSGQTSDWVQAKNGWYLLKVESRTESRIKTFEECKRGIEEKMTAALQDAKFKEFMQALKKKSYIKILKPRPLEETKAPALTS
jgi:parvulin-like peptidyl-prolyl isomerase